MERAGIAQGSKWVPPHKASLLFRLKALQGNVTLLWVTV